MLFPPCPAHLQPQIRDPFLASVSLVALNATLQSPRPEGWNELAADLVIAPPAAYVTQAKEMVALIDAGKTNDYGVPLVMLQSDRHKRDSKAAGMIVYDRSARSWVLTALGRETVGS